MGKSKGPIIFFASYVDKTYFQSDSSRIFFGLWSAHFFAAISYGPPFENRWDGHSYLNSYSHYSSTHRLAALSCTTSCAAIEADATMVASFAASVALYLVHKPQT